ncbi:helix-turn-helix domain-containing protein [Orrella dioscoreae]|uniref:Cro/CI family transcriptional regulator n=1 Tax=Orrella dioscoreae TaxID=1851544 RepID=UPI00082BDAAB|nr:Cro/CI family transcriptional regulator [Orrella dioscoreae]
MSTRNLDSELIDSLGGTAQVAQLCEVTTGAVSQWRTNGIPKAWLKFFAAHKPEIYKLWEATRPEADRSQEPAHA